MNYYFRNANSNELAAIWQILEKAIQRRKADGSQQWQDGYPNPYVISNDIQKEQGYVLILDDEIIGYCAVLINDEPAYDSIEGKWLSKADFVVIHRLAIKEEYVGKGIAKLILTYVENLAKTKEIYSVKADTNFDNIPMMKILEKTGYSYCGEVHFRGSARRAYEKLL